MQKPLEKAGEEYLRIRQQVIEASRQDDARRRQQAGEVVLRSVTRAITYLETPVIGPGGRPDIDKVAGLKNSMERAWGRLGQMGLKPEELKIDEIRLEGGNRIVFDNGRPETEDRVVVDLPELRKRVDEVKKRYKRK